MKRCTASDMTNRDLSTRFPDFVNYWSRELGLENGEIARLGGGINNQVYRCGTGKDMTIIKGFPFLPADGQNRMNAEIDFLRYASVAAPGLTPRLIHVDHERNCILLEDIKGEMLAEGEVPTAVMISKAIIFVRLLNHDRDMAREYIKQNAKEGYLSLSEHVRNVKERVEAIDCGGLSIEERLYAHKLKKTVGRGISLAGERLMEAIADGAVEDTIRADQLYISPSDFGFHNAIKAPEGLVFIDFEFAGWDDPAKVSLDFLLQPRIPIACEDTPLIEAWNRKDRSHIRNRCIYLEPILELKWACIMLAVLDQHRLARLRTMKTEEEVSGIIDGHLMRIKAYIESRRHIETV